MNQQPAVRVTGNIFLDNLPAHVLEMIMPCLLRVSLKHGVVINDYNSVIDKVFFPIGSIISIVLDMANGTAIEVGIVGREGMTGLGIVLGRSSLPQRSIVQVPDSAYSVSGNDFRRFIQQSPEFKVFALRYAQATILMTTQLAACNTVHQVNERCARWLLMAHDRVPNDLIILTQEHVSQMLGVRRASVTIAASALQEAGFISYTRGQIIIRNRFGLESAACECYKNQERDLTEIMGYSIYRG